MFVFSIFFYFLFFLLILVLCWHFSGFEFYDCIPPAPQAAGPESGPVSASVILHCQDNGIVMILVSNKWATEFISWNYAFCILGVSIFLQSRADHFQELLRSWLQVDLGSGFLPLQLPPTQNTFNFFYPGKPNAWPQQPTPW